MIFYSLFVLITLFLSGFLCWKKWHFTLTPWPGSTHIAFRVSKIFHYFHFRLLRSRLTCLFLRLFVSFFSASWTWSILKIPNAKQHLIIFLWKLSFFSCVFNPCYFNLKINHGMLAWARTIKTDSFTKTEKKSRSSCNGFVVFDLAFPLCY